MTQQNRSTTVASSSRLFERGLVCLEPENIPVEVSRGMLILTQEGWEAGMVAAVVVEDHSQQVTHLLLVRPHPVSDYHLVSVGLIERVSQDAVWLHLHHDAIESLPHPDTAG
jgi:hypothetical protein